MHKKLARWVFPIWLYVSSHRRNRVSYVISTISAEIEFFAVALPSFLVSDILSNVENLSAEAV